MEAPPPPPPSPPTPDPLVLDCLIRSQQLSFPGFCLVLGYRGPQKVRSLLRTSPALSKHFQRFESKISVENQSSTFKDSESKISAENQSSTFKDSESKISVENQPSTLKDSESKISVKN